MRTEAILRPALSLMSFLPANGRPDFKSTQTSQITGGAVASMVRMPRVFSKGLREPGESTTYVQGNFLHVDKAADSYEIVDVKLSIPNMN